MNTALSVIAKPHRPKSITVNHFFETHRDRLKMELVAGASGMRRAIREVSINRPSLALTGFFKYFPNKRIQVLGAGEMTYLKTLSEAKQRKTFQEFAKRRVPCIILSRNYNPTKAIRETCEKNKLPLLRTPMITMNFINVATLCVDNEFAPSTTLHGTMMDIKGIGVLIRGDSGVGKSECALALIERGHTLVADDFTRIRLLDERELMASSPELNRGHMECRGLGIINVGELFGIRSVRLEKRIDMVISLREFTSDAVEERTGLEQSKFDILGIDLPHVELYVRPGRDIARLVEVAALVEALKKMGHDPAQEFNDRLIAFMAEKR